MGPRDEDLRSLCRILDIQHIDLHAVRGLELFTLDLFVLAEQRVRLAEIDRIGFSLLSGDDAGDQLLHLAVVLVKDDVPLLLADPLENDVLRILRRDPSEAPGVDIYRNNVSRLDRRIILSRLRNSHLHDRIDDVLFALNDFLFRCHGIVKCIRINAHSDIIVLTEIGLACLHQGKLDGLQKGFLADALFSLQQFNCLF